MFIKDSNNLAIEFSKDDLSGNTTIITLDRNTGDELGRIVMKETRVRFFLESLGIMFRENFGPLQEHESGRARLDNRSSGTIDFED